MDDGFFLALTVSEVGLWSFGEMGIVRGNGEEKERHCDCDLRVNDSSMVVDGEGDH